MRVQYRDQNKRAGAPQAIAIQMRGAFRYMGRCYPPGDWVLIWPGARAIIAQHLMWSRFERVEAGTYAAHSAPA